MEIINETLLENCSMTYDQVKTVVEQYADEVKAYMARTVRKSLMSSITTAIPKVTSATVQTAETIQAAEETKMTAIPTTSSKPAGTDTSMDVDVVVDKEKFVQDMQTLEETGYGQSKLGHGIQRYAPSREWGGHGPSDYSQRYVDYGRGHSYHNEPRGPPRGRDAGPRGRASHDLGDHGKGRGGRFPEQRRRSPSPSGRPYGRGYNRQRGEEERYQYSMSQSRAMYQNPNDEPIQTASDRSSASNAASSRSSSVMDVDHGKKPDANQLKWPALHPSAPPAGTKGTANDEQKAEPKKKEKKQEDFQAHTSIRESSKGKKAKKTDKAESSSQRVPYKQRVNLKPSRDDDSDSDRGD